MRMIIAAVSVWLCLVAVALAGTPTYWVYEPSAPLQPAYDDPVRISGARWQMWLFPSGSRADSGLFNAWGILEGRSAAEVMRQLEKSRALDAWYTGNAEIRDLAAYTYANPVGPVVRRDPLPSENHRSVAAWAAEAEEVLASSLERHGGLPGPEFGAIAAGAGAINPLRAATREYLLILARTSRMIAELRAGLERPANLQPLLREVNASLQSLEPAERSLRFPPAIPDETRDPSLWDFTFPALGAVESYRVRHALTQEGDGRWHIRTRTSNPAGTREYGTMDLIFDMTRLREAAVVALATSTGSADARAQVVLQFEAGAVTYKRVDSAGQVLEGSAGVIEMLYPTHAIAERSQMVFEQALRQLNANFQVNVERIQLLRIELGKVSLPFRTQPEMRPAMAGTASAEPPVRPTTPDGADFGSLFDALFPKR